MTATRLLVTGGRNYADRAFLFRTLDEMHAAQPIEVVIHGAASGADELAKQWALSRLGPAGNHPYPAAWDDIDVPGAVIRMNRRGKPYNLVAGFQRNDRMLRLSCPTHCVAFSGGNGTQDMVVRVKAAIRAGQAIELVDLRTPTFGNGWSGAGRAAG